VARGVGGLPLRVRPLRADPLPSRLALYELARPLGLNAGVTFVVSCPRRHTGDLYSSSFSRNFMRASSFFLHLALIVERAFRFYVGSWCSLAFTCGAVPVPFVLFPQLYVGFVRFHRIYPIFFAEKFLSLLHMSKILRTFAAAKV